MSKLSALALTAALAVGGSMAFEAPAAAQNRGLLQVVVYGDDPCPRSTDDEIVVCARKPEADRYRIPEELRPTGSRQASESWALRAKNLETVSATGTMSCSAVGPGGWTGCLDQLISRSMGQRRETNAGNRPPE